MQVKKAGGKVYGAVLTAAEKKSDGYGNPAGIGRVRPQTHC